MNLLAFVQFTDMHLGKSFVFPQHITRQIEENFKIAMAEITKLKPMLDFLAITGDAVNTGLPDIKKYRKLIENLDMKIYHIPSSHDLALGALADGNIILNDDNSFWEKNIGPTRNVFTRKGVKFLFFEPFRKVDEKKGMNIFDADIESWLTDELKKCKTEQPIIIGYHIPILPRDGKFMGWDKAEKFISILKEYNILACICGHRHRNDEDTINGITQIQTGPLAGFQWTGLAPHYMFPVRAGYRIFQVEDGVLRSFYKEIGVKNQITLEKINGIHTLGPRPMARPAVISSDASLFAQTYSEDSEIKKVEYFLENGKHGNFRMKYDGMWSEWQAEILYRDFHEKFNVICVKATTRSGLEIYDNVPIFVKKENPSTYPESGPEMMFDLITQASEAEFINSDYNFPWALIS
jgi:hypothetical protein